MPSRSGSISLRFALLAVASRACGSISVLVTLLAPSLMAAIARMPEPQPKSNTDLVSGGFSSKN